MTARRDGQPAAAGLAAARLTVDFIACDGRGLCADALPELITLDDWGFPVIRRQAVPPWLLADARETVRLCPMLALSLDDGRRPAGARRRTGRRSS